MKRLDRYLARAIWMSILLVLLAIVGIDSKTNSAYDKIMNYEWDEQKRATNITKHGVDFVEIENFDWATALTILDTRFEESRYVALGLIENRLYAVAYTVRETSTRLISMRKANRREIRKYEQA